MARSDVLSQLVFIGPAEPVARIQGFIKASGGVFSTMSFHQAGSLNEVQRLAQQAAPQVTLVVSVSPQITPEFEEWLRKLNQYTQIVALFIADDPDLQELTKRHGHPLGVPLTGLGTKQLNDALMVALEFQNVRAQRDQLQQLYSMAEERFQDMANLYAEWMWEIDADLKITFSSTRKRPAVNAVKGSAFTQCFLPEERLRIEDDFAELAREPKVFFDRDYWSEDPYGSRICWSVSGTPILDPGGIFRGYRGVARDVSSLKAATDQIYYLVHHDPLTGVMNRQRCQDELVRTIRAAKRENRSGALIILDIDRFSYVNQTHGHVVGDKLLIHLGQILRDNVRTGDIVARLDGDTFAVVLRDVRGEEIVGRVERLQATLASRPLVFENKGHSTSISINVSGGMAVYPTDADTADQLLAFAGDALSRAKVRGPNKIERYDPIQQTATAAQGQLEWVEMLNECLNDHATRLVLHYQPIVPISGPAVVAKAEHYEVLMRLVDRDGQLLVPGKFITAAEEFGLISKIDHLVTSRAIDMLKIWHQQGRHVHLSVNLSGKTFDDQTFLDRVKTLLKEANLPPKALVFEITETALLRDLQLVKQFIMEMRALGAGFALDDCGVGYSSFNYIRQLDLDFIKIDGSFVRNLHNSEEDQAFVQALADIAKQKNISTVAEMVEHEAAMVALKTMGIDFAQGFFFAPPAPDLQATGWNKRFLN